MIIRFFRAVVHAGKEDEFAAVFQGTILPMVRSQEGLISASIGLPMESSPQEFCMVMVWRDLAAVKVFAGEHWQEAVIDPSEAHLLAQTFVDHYQTSSAESA